jgi:hypothetical protein
MKLVARTPRFHVYDEFLPEADFAAVWNYVQLETYAPVHRDTWVKVWRIGDGIPLGATTAVLYQKSGPAGAAPDEHAKRGEFRIYPTHSGIDRALARIVEHLGDFADLIGERDVDFDKVSARSFLYSRGTALSWHEDDTCYSGGYAYYVHPEWRSQWGGELLIADESTRPEDVSGEGPVLVERRGGALKATRVRIPPFLDNTRQDAVLSRQGMGRYIAPKPNRLVVIAGGTPHRINPVNDSAGDHVRSTIAGFFHRPAS